MTLLLKLAWASLWHERVHLFCNVAILAGTLIPLLVLFGAKTGVYKALLDDLRSDANLLRIVTLGDHEFFQDDLDRVKSWPETRFAALRTRSIADEVLVQRADGGRRQLTSMIPSGLKDPLLDEGVDVTRDQVAISAGLARRLSIEVGDSVLVISRTEVRRPLVFEFKVSGIVPAGKIAGHSILMTSERMDLVEAYIDGYALPELGLADGRPIEDRTVAFEGLRVYAQSIEDVQRLEEQIQDAFEVRTRSRSIDIAGNIKLSRYLNVAIVLIASIAVAGLAAALLFGFWAEVDRKKRVLATLALLGLSKREIALVPLIQALAISVVGIVLSFLLFACARAIADNLFGFILPGDRSIIVLDFGAVLLAVILPILVVLASSLYAAFSALRIDPAITLRTA